MLTRFLPKNEKFYDYFRQAAEVGDKIAQAFVDLVSNYTDVERKVRAIRDIEHQGDDLSRAISNALTQTFVTPIDREDIVLLSGRLDDFIDAVEEAARRMWLYRIPEPTPHIKAMAKVIAQQGKALVQAMPLMENPAQNAELLRLVAEIKKLEDEADALMDKATVEIYDGVDDVKALITSLRLTELYQYLEDATDRAQDVAKALESIALKHS